MPLPCWSNGAEGTVVDISWSSRRHCHWAIRSPTAAFPSFSWSLHHSAWQFWMLFLIFFWWHTMEHSEPQKDTSRRGEKKGEKGKGKKMAFKIWDIPLPTNCSIAPHRNRHPATAPQRRWNGAQTFRTGRLVVSWPELASHGNGDLFEHIEIYDMLYLESFGYFPDVSAEFSVAKLEE